MAAVTTPIQRPRGAVWSPVTWFRLLLWRWRLYGPVGDLERHGYYFWGPAVGLVLGVELLAALELAWGKLPTISSTVGHLEMRWDWVAVIVVGLITVVAFHTIAYRTERREGGRAYRRVLLELTTKGAVPEQVDLGWYNALLVLGVTAGAWLLALALGASKYHLGYVVYGTLGFVGILLPSLLAYYANRVVRFPTLFFTIDKLRHRLHLVATVILAGLAILAVHLSFYPWPDITHESASFAGLNADQARTAAQTAVEQNQSLHYSTQARGVDHGHDAWFVYFDTSGGATCVVIVTQVNSTLSPDCTS
jgi:hypothetical protein